MDGGIADQKAESDFWLLSDREQAQFFIEQGEPASGGNAAVIQREDSLEGLTAVERKRAVFGSNN